MITEMTQNLKLKIIDETAEAYTSKTRSMEGYSCAYVCDHIPAKGCAIGRLLTVEERATIVRIDEERDAAFKGQGLGYNRSAVNILIEANLLPKRLIELGFPFLKALQRLHDNPECWNDTGLSTKGETRKEDIIFEVVKGVI